MVMTAPLEPATSLPSSSRLVSTCGRELPLTSVHLAAEAGGGIARVVLTQRFENPYAEPLEVRYLLPLPSDGAVSGFSFVIGDERVVGRVTGKEEARARFERALVEGRTAALLEQERSSLFTQRVGNVPPGASIVAEVIVDQRLRWLDEGAWEWRFPTVVGPRYMGEPGRVADAGRLAVPVAEGELGARATLVLTLADAPSGPVSSPSHSCQASRAREDGVTVRFGGDGAVRLDRDVVVRWPVALPSVSARVLAARPEGAAGDDAFALLTVAPPTGGWTPVRRDLTFLIDTSGSMGGRPLDQAKRVIAAMIETLGVHDRLELIEFGSYPRRWKDAPQDATEATKRAALKWVHELSARGGTEMHTAVLEALRPLRADSQRQVVLVTDGYIGFEAEIVATLLRELPPGARLHTVGVGSAVNRSLTQAAARAGRGCELILGLGEEPERAVGRLLARTTAPLVTDLVLEGAGLRELAPRQLPDLYAEAPALIAARVAAGGGELVLRGRTAEGAFEQRLRVPALARGEGPAGVVALFAREKVEDIEMALTAGGPRHVLDAELAATGVAYQVATRLTSWVAVSERVTVAAEAARRVVEQPHELPYGVSAEGLGLRAAAPQVARAQPSGRAMGGSAKRARMAFEEVKREEGAAPRGAGPSPAPALGAPAPLTQSGIRSHGPDQGDAAPADEDSRSVREEIRLTQSGAWVELPSDEELEELTKLTRDGRAIDPTLAEIEAMKALSAMRSGKRRPRRAVPWLLLLVLLALAAIALWVVGVSVGVLGGGGAAPGGAAPPSGPTAPAGEADGR